MVVLFFLSLSSLSCQKLFIKKVKVQELVKSAYFVKSGDWIYFSNLADNNKIYKIKADLSQQTKVSDEVISFDSPFIILNGWIYFTSPSVYEKTQAMDNNSISKIQLDGSNKLTLVNTAGLVVFQDILAYYQDWIYYLERGEEYVLFRIRPDGSKKEKIKEGVYWVTINQKWIVYQNLNDNQLIYKMRLNGTEDTKVNNEASQNLVLDEDWIYYISKSDGVLRKLNLQNNKTESVLSQHDIYPEYANKGWLYYSDGMHRMDQYRFNFEEKKIEQISGPMNNSTIIDDCLYYFTNEHPGRLFRLHLDTFERIVIR